jgi:hypothetical protein
MVMTMMMIMMVIVVMTVMVIVVMIVMIVMVIVVMIVMIVMVMVVMTVVIVIVILLFDCYILNNDFLDDNFLYLWSFPSCTAFMLTWLLHIDNLLDNLDLSWFRMAIRVNFDLYRNALELVRDWFDVDIVNFEVIQWTDPEILTTVICEMLPMVDVKARHS